MQFSLAILTFTLLLTGITHHASAQAIQLPTFRLFSTSSSVLVPDRGSVYLGGVDHAAYGSSQRGLSRSIGSSVGSSGVSVHATIIDHDEIDRALLAEAARRRGDTHDVLGRPVDGGIALGESTYQSPARTAETTSAADAIRRKAAYLSRHVTRNR